MKYSLDAKCTCGHSRGSHAEDNYNTCMIDFCKCNVFCVAACDPVKSPSHYIGTDGLEVKEVIRQFDLGFFTGGAVKYILRAGKKGDAIEDFKKAIEMLNIEIDNLNRKGSK